MSWTSDRVPYQCSTVDSAQGKVATCEDELSNIEGHMDDTKDYIECLEGLTMEDMEDWDMTEIRDNIANAMTEITDMAIDLSDASDALSGHEEDLESLRSACTDLRELAVEATEESAETISDLEAAKDELEEDVRELNETLDKAKLRILELQKLNDPMLKIVFPSSMSDEEKLERWNTP